MSEKQSNAIIFGAVVIALLFSLSICYRIVTTSSPIDFDKVGVSDILAFVVAMFAIWLSVSFYHKTNESASQFYHDTHIFTSKVSEVLGRMEATFGEKLSHIDQRVNSLPVDISNVQSELESKQGELERVLEEKERLSTALKQADSDTSERTRQLAEYDTLVQELTVKNRQVAELEDRLHALEHEGHMAAERNEEILKKLHELRTADLPTKISVERASPISGRLVLEKIAREMASGNDRRRPVDEFERNGNKLLKELSSKELDMLKSAGYVENEGLTRRGLLRLRDAVIRFSS